MNAIIDIHTYTHTGNLYRPIRSGIILVCNINQFTLYLPPNGS